MKTLGKTLLAALALTAGASGLSSAAQARTYVEFGISSYDGYRPYYGGYRGYDRDWDRRRDWYRADWERRRYDDWRWRHGGYWRDDGDYWRYRERCWTDWRYDDWSGRTVPVRICR